MASRKEQPSPLYQEILACFERQRTVIVAQVEFAGGTPEYLAAEEILNAEDKIYDKLLQNTQSRLWQRPLFNTSEN